MTKDLVHNWKARVRILLITLVFCSGISISKDQLSDNILAKVGKKEITVAEFKARCELTVRPDNFKDKSTALNNLIIEKILSLEAEKKNSLESNPVFQARLKGIKEQAMREKLYDNVASSKATVDTNKLKNAYRLSMREYELEFYRMHKNVAQKVKAWIDTASGRIDDMFLSLSEFTGKQPKHKVTYKDPEADTLHEALFSKPLQIGDVLGPIDLGYDEYLVMKVLDWTDYPLISGEDQRERWNEVREKEHSIAASKLWQSYHAEIMKGKKIEFDKRTFLILANWVREKYIVGQQQKVPSGNPIPEILFSANGLDLTSPFFTFEGKVWTVGDFKNELMSRPLLFRTIDLDSVNFNTQFELAIVDIMEDHCFTREAYKKSLDEGEDITRAVNMWKDSYLANEKQKNVVDIALKEGKIIKDDGPGILKYWESFVNDLQKKYSDSISVNIDVFKNISLTKIDMVAIKPGMPYPVMVPDFPVFLSSKLINYGSPKE